MRDKSYIKGVFNRSDKSGINLNQSKKNNSNGFKFFSKFNKLTIKEICLIILTFCAVIFICLFIYVWFFEDFGLG